MVKKRKKSIHPKRDWCERGLEILHLHENYGKGAVKRIEDMFAKEQLPPRTKAAIKGKCRVEGIILDCIWTDEQTEYLRSFKNQGTNGFRNGKNTVERAKEGLLEKFGVERSTVALYTKFCKEKIPVRAREVDLFNKIDSDEKSYYVGWMGSDGNNLESRGCIKLSITDKEPIENFRDFIGVNNKIKIIPAGWREIKGKMCWCKKQWSYSFSCKMASKALAKLGIVSAKSLTYKFPKLDQIPFEFMRGYLRGMLDGDGSIYENSDKKGRWCVDFTGSPFWIKGLSKMLVRIFGPRAPVNLPSRTPTTLLRFSIEVGSKLSKPRNVDKVRISHQHTVLRFLEWAYEGSTPKTRLNRKYKKALQAIKDIRTNQE